MAIKPINVVITGFDRASRVFGSISQKAAGLGKSIEKIGGVSKKLGMGALGLGVGAAFATGLSGIPGQLIQIEESAARLAFTEKFTAAESLKVGKAVRQMSRETLQSQLDLNSAIDKIGDAGFTLDETLSILPQAGKAATAFGKPLSLLSDISFSLGSQFKVAAGEMSGAIDIVSELGTANFDLDELAMVLPRIGQASKSLNLNGREGLAQFAAGLEVIRGETRDSGMAAKGFAKLLEGVFDSSTLEKFRKGGVDGPGVDVLAELEEAGKRGVNQMDAYLALVKRVTDSEDKATRETRIKDLFGDAEATAIRAILDNLDKYNEALKRYRRASGRTEVGFQKHLETTSAQWKMLRGTVLSMDFKPAARGITMLNNALKWMNEGNGENAEKVVKGILGAVAVGGGLFAIGSLASILADISTVMAAIAKGGPKVINILKGMAGVQAATAASSFAASSSVGGAGAGAAAGAASGAWGMGMAGPIAAAVAAAIGGGILAVRQSMRAGRGELSPEEERAYGFTGSAYSGQGGLSRGALPRPMSNPEAVRAAAGQGAARVEGEMVVRLENFPAGTKTATKSKGMDIRPELGMAFP